MKPSTSVLNVSSIIRVKELRGRSHLPINCIIFSKDGKYLIAGGDDEAVFIWNMDTFQCDQTIENDKWGQITALTLTNAGVHSEGLNTNVNLCIGCGRGCISIVPMESGSMKPFVMDKSTTTDIFSFNDSIEAQVYDAKRSMLAVASHSGGLKVFSISESSLSIQWSANPTSTIPGSIFFAGNRNEHIVMLLLETSEIFCRELLTGKVLWRKVLTGGIGGAALSEDRTLMLIDNLSSGQFELYRYPEAELIMTLPNKSKKRFTKQCAFLKGTDQVICGSDHNILHIVDISRNEIIHELVTSTDSSHMTQTLAFTSTNAARKLIAAESGGSLFVWEQPFEREDLVKELPNKKMKVPGTQPVATSGNWKIILLVVVLTYSSWSPYFLEIISYISMYVKTISAVGAEGQAVIAL